MKEEIFGDILEFVEHPEYKGDYIAKWRGYTVATAMVQQNGTVEITEWHPDQINSYYANAANINAAWRHIKNYTITDFDDELRDYLAPGQGFKK